MQLPKSETLFKQSPWISFPSADWGSLLKTARLARYKKGEVIYHQNAPTNYVYIVKEGRVNCSILGASGEEKCLYVAAEGCLFGETTHIGATDSCVQAVAKDNCTIYLIEASVFLDCVYSDPALISNVLLIMANKIRLLTGQVELLSFFDANCRVCEMLSYLSTQYGVPTDEGILLDIHFTHQELADMVGATRVTVTNVMNDLIKKRIIKRKGSSYYVLDMHGLLQVPGPSAQHVR